MRYFIIYFLLFSFFGSRETKTPDTFIEQAINQNLHNLTSAWPVMLLTNQRLPDGNQILAGIMSLLKSIIIKPGQDSIHELIIWKVNAFVASVSWSQYQIAFNWWVSFWLQLFSIRWDEKYFNGWNFYLDILQIQENWGGRNFIANSRLYSLLITQAKMQTEIINN